MTRVVAKAGRATQAVGLHGAEPILLLTGTHEPSHLGRTSTPLFISRHAFFNEAGKEMKSKPRALGPWAMDSGGFTEVVYHGKWRINARQYATFVARMMDEVGNLLWAAPQDWMCEPPALAKTGLTARDHQQRTVDNFVELRSIAPSLPIIPVLQGFWGPFSEGSNLGGDKWVWDNIDVHPRGPGATYEDHIAMYDAAGVDLREYPLVGIGSVCRRAESPAFFLHLQRQLAPLQAAGVRFHAFGFKTTSLDATAHNDFLASIDSLAWSFAGRSADERLVPWHTHAKCGNCLEALLLWRARILTQFPHLYAPTKGPLAPGDVLTPRFLKLQESFRKKTLDDAEKARADDYPTDSGATRLQSSPSELRAALESLPAGVYFSTSHRYC